MRPIYQVLTLALILTLAASGSLALDLPPAFCTEADVNGTTEAVCCLEPDPVNLTFNLQTGQKLTGQVENCLYDLMCPAVICLQNTTAPVGINLTLDPGQTIQASRENCHYTAACSPAQNASLTACQASVSIGSGERYRLQNGVCDLDMRCKEPDEGACPTVELLEQEVYINVTKDPDGTVTVQGPRDRLRVEGNATFFTGGLKAKVQCPAIPYTGDGDIPADIAWTYENCKQWIDWADERNFVGFDIYAKYLSSCQEEVTRAANECMNQKDSANSQMIQCQQDKADLQERVTVQAKELETLATVAKENESLKEDRLAIAFSFLIVLGLAVYAYWRGIHEDGWFRGGVKIK